MKSSLFKISSIYKKVTGLFMTKPPVEKPTDLEDYLSYYQGLENPRYAVLVTGEWGVGKTFQVCRAIPPDKHYYVSLFGVRGTDEVEAAVFAQMFPWKEKARTFAEKSDKASLLGFPVGILGGLYARYARKNAIKTDRTIIFDDLERSNMDPKDLLGVINQYIEHHKCRVLVIAHDDELSGELLKQREKLFGQVIRAAPQIDLAYPVFAGELGSAEEQNFLLGIQPTLIALFKESEVHSLRILRHVIEDTLRVMRCLTLEQRKHPDAVKELVNLIAALNFECRFNRIKANDLVDRKMQIAKYSWKERDVENQNAAKPPIIAANERYKTVRLDSELLPDDLILEMLIAGIYRSDQIASAVNASSYFARPSDLPAWRTFIEFDDEEDDIAEEAMRRFNEEFEKRRIFEPGEILHMFALRMMQATHGLIQRSVSDTFSDCINYVDELRAAGKLKPLPTAWREKERLERAYGGLSYWVEETYQKEWSDILRYLHDQRHLEMLKSLEAAAPEVLKLVEEDGNKLYSILNHTADDIEKFANVPVLVSIDPEQFVNAWLKSHPKNWYWIKSAILERLKHGDKAKLDAETAWTQKIAELMEKEATRTQDIRALRIRRSIPRLPCAE